MPMNQSGGNKPSTENRTTWVQLTPGNFVTGRPIRIQSDVKKNEAEAGKGQVWFMGMTYVVVSVFACLWKYRETEACTCMYMDAMLHIAYIKWANDKKCMMVTK